MGSRRVPSAHDRVTARVDGPVFRVPLLRLQMPCHAIPFRVQYVRTPRGKRLLRRVWKADTERPRGVILMLHGIHWHSGYFSRAASKLNDLNFLDVVSYDAEVSREIAMRRGILVVPPSDSVLVQGHGRSDGIRGYVPSIQNAVEDCEQMLQVMGSPRLLAPLPAPPHCVSCAAAAGDSGGLWGPRALLCVRREHGGTGRASHVHPTQEPGPHQRYVSTSAPPTKVLSLGWCPLVCECLERPGLPQGRPGAEAAEHPAYISRPIGPGIWPSIEETRPACPTASL